MGEVRTDQWQDTTTDVVEGVALPLKNLEFMIDEYLLENGLRLDVETRFLLAGVRDCLGQVACSTLMLTQHRNRQAPN